VTVTLVTGGLGYVGRATVSLLAQRGDTVVTYNRDYAHDPRPAVTPVQGELHDLPRLTRAIRELGVERIVHTAAQSNPDFSLELPLSTVTANVDGTVHIYEAARMTGVERVVNFSSECAYGHQDATVTELGAVLRPTTPYGVTKVAGELMADVYNHHFGLDVLSLRVAEVYGPGQAQPIVLREMIRAALAGEPYRLDSGGDHRFHWVYIDDVARAAVLALDCERAAQSVYNVSGGGHWSLFDGAEAVRTVLPEADIELGGGHWYLDRQGPWDGSAAERDLGFAPSVSLEEGVRRYADWLREHDY
jgi:UDP-glucose 4-epimerase